MKHLWLYFMLPLFLIVPILTYEGLIGWGIAIFGLMRCYNYEKQDLKKKYLYAARMLVICWLLGFAHYYLVTYGQDVVMKFFL